MEAQNLIGVTLEKTPIGSFLNYVNTVGGGKGTRLPMFVWDTASAIFANNSTGKAQAVIRVVNPGSVFMRIEQKILLKNNVEIILR